MNPFDLRGPQFLVFYIFFSWLVIVALTLLRRLSEDRDTGKPPIDDPYFVAYLRGGESEALRVATLSLIDRGLLTLKSSGSPTLLPGSADRPPRTRRTPLPSETVKRPIEKRILEAFKTARPIHPTLASLEGCTACFDYATNLEKFGLLPDAEEVRKAPSPPRCHCHWHPSRRRRRENFLSLSFPRSLAPTFCSSSFFPALLLSLHSKTAIPFCTVRGEKVSSGRKISFQLAPPTSRFSPSRRRDLGPRLARFRLRTRRSLPHPLSLE